MAGAVLAAAALGMAGCYGVMPQQKKAKSSSVVAFLYPKETNPLPPPGLPVLRLPLRVGIAFVPSRGFDISEMQKSALLGRVAAEFKGREYIESIEVVPTTYLREGGGFDNLDQVRRMLNFDVIALVAFDQVQFTDHNLLSLAYWTIVGAYVFQGSRNDTQTMMEAAVYDIPSRKLLFRAPGVSQVKAGTALVYAQHALREDGLKGFDQATDNLIANLKTQLEDFRTRVKQAPDAVAKIEHKPGYKGGGAADGWWAGGLLLLLAARWAVRRR